MRVSPTTGIAVLALFFALGGSASPSPRPYGLRRGASRAQCERSSP